MKLDDRFALSLDELDQVQGGHGKCFGGTSAAVSTSSDWGKSQTSKMGFGGYGADASFGFGDPHAGWSVGASVDTSAKGASCGSSGWSDSGVAMSIGLSTDWSKDDGGGWGGGWGAKGGGDWSKDGGGDGSDKGGGCY